MLKRGTFIVLLSIIGFSIAQPCLTGWTYRMPIIIDNSSTAEVLTDYQVKLELNTQLLISQGKMKLDGGDIRFLNKTGQVLPYWVENNTFNNIKTTVWVKVDEIKASSQDTVYLFYGESSSISLSNGDQTFELFDDFLGASVDGTKWESCTPANVSVSGGELTLSSTSITDNAVITSVSDFDVPVVTESFVTEVNEGKSFMGLVDASNRGYSMVYDKSGTGTIRMLKIDNAINCVTLSDVDTDHNASRNADSPIGVWGFVWRNPGIQEYYWEGYSFKESWDDLNHAIPTKGNVILGNTENIGAIKFDWLRVRKHILTEPTVTLGGEEASVFVVVATANKLLCESNTISLNASDITGAIYIWEGPNNFIQTGQSVEIPNALSLMSGEYKVTASLAGGCSSASDSVIVQVDPTTISGEIIGNNTVCEANHSGTVTVNNYTGTVQQWEVSETGLAPWSTVDFQENELIYANLNQSTYYRAFIKSGVCTGSYTDSVKISVDALTDIGSLLGNTEGCAKVNTGLIKLYESVGEVVNWQKREESALAWTDFLNTSSEFTFNNLEATTFYRLKIKNGVCQELLSDSVTVTINPLPEVDFEATTVCLKEQTEFTNNTLIKSGRIKDYVWNFDDGRSSVLQSPKHTYTTFNEYKVLLRAESDKGCESFVIKDVKVNPLPVVDFFQTNVCDRIEMDFTQNVNVSLPSSIVGYKWGFGDFVGTATGPTTSYLYVKDGDYSVELVAETNLGCRDSVTKKVTVYPRADLSFIGESVFLGEESSFSNNSSISQGNLNFQWFFGDGQTIDGVNVKHSYAKADTFDVKLVSLSSYGDCKDTLVNQYIVNDQTKADFTVEDVCLYDSARFVNTSFIPVGSLNYVWDFGDGDTSSLENPRHKYISAGTYLVKLVAISDLGSMSVVSKNITINPIPDVSFVTQDVCDAISVTCSNLSDITSGAMTHSWTFGDGGTSVDLNPTHLYATSGTYEITLISTSDKSCKDTINKSITIFPKPLTHFTVASVCDGFASNFFDSTFIGKGSVENYVWDFGDGTNSIVKDPVKQFLNPGDYIVQLTTTSDQGCTRSTSQRVKVYKTPVANFTVQNQCFGTSVRPSNRSTAEEGVLSYVWTFGDETDKVIFEEPIHIYSLPNDYAIKLIATTSFGCQDSLTKSVRVHASPTIVAGEEQTISQGYTTALTAKGGTDYFWTPATGLENEGTNSPSATPLETTIYTVSVIDENGCTGSDKTRIVVEQDYKLNPSNIITPDGNNENDTWYVGNIETFENSTVMVFDRWGKQVFKTDNYQNDWQAVSGSDILPEGEYYYVITFGDTDKVYKGTITVMR